MVAHDSRNFYARLPIVGDLEELANADSFRRLPADWHVAMSDVRDSTEAIRAGRYKQVNLLGAATVIAVLNAAGRIEIPFVFGGDGAALCVPDELLGDTRAALLRTQQLARRSFGLELRIATVPVAEIERAGFAIWVARYRVSEHYVQPVFAGGGMTWADRMLKDPASAPRYAVRPDATPPRANYEGLECRWQDIPSPHGETVSLMVRPMSEEPERQRATYVAVVAKVREIYGGDASCHPVSESGLSLALGARELAAEVGIRAGSVGRLGRWAYLQKVRGLVALGSVAMRLGLRARGTDWGRYKRTLVRNTEVRKFSDHYSQILSGTPAQRAALAAWLEERFAERELVYGLHVSDRAHMTCLVFDYAGRHLHFVDGADGGLFLAARALKERLRRAAAAPAACERRAEP